MKTQIRLTKTFPGNIYCIRLFHMSTLIFSGQNVLYTRLLRSLLLFGTPEYGIQFNSDATDKDGNRPLDLCKKPKIASQ